VANPLKHTTFLKQAMVLIHRFTGNHASRASGRVCYCDICQDAYILFDEVVSLTRATVDPKLLTKEVPTDCLPKKF
jgi:hypothetical protein